MKNAELEALFEQRNLAHTYKKADMAARLQVQPSDAPVATTANAEDEINWDDDTTTDAAGKPAASAATSGTSQGYQHPQPSPAWATRIFSGRALKNIVSQVRK
ncbi:uncharacterized protein K452DRAFT_339532 [Aplosporella prunicola CBS 121167]|uniref:SAP domain-containing protein n=1 Tax=Aplosporella prunicola CBS 121167 TaxID=1176127 RepID=A0A6A6B1F3_9PEZI|nr:uncharacterized protein K452DRAFT_339532 [Aplosporella prunicola CBS 121167]KAF2137870.1 hypothetical protein K452DRAFT_339532 [Aplosporella prunicola CBS 121167]